VLRSWLALFTNANDGTNEGIVHATRDYFSVQFHPEHMAGPSDSEFLFDLFVATVVDVKRDVADAKSIKTRITEHLTYEVTDAMKAIIASKIDKVPYTYRNPPVTRARAGARSRLGRPHDRAGGRVRLLWRAGIEGVARRGHQDGAHEPERCYGADGQGLRDEHVLASRDDRLCRAGTRVLQ